MPFSRYSSKQKKLARVAPPRNKITGADLKKLRGRNASKNTNSRKKAWARRTFDTYPSAYANLAASKYCKDPNYAKKAKGGKRKGR